MTRAERWTLRLAIGLALLAVTLYAPNRAQGQTTEVAHRTVAVLYIERMDPPPPEYARWYADAERCIGLRGHYDQVRWYVTDHRWTDGGPGFTYGDWRPPHRITVTRDDGADSVLVMHEAIHDILSWYPVTDSAPHPRPWFDGRCARADYP